MYKRRVPQRANQAQNTVFCGAVIGIPSVSRYDAAEPVNTRAPARLWRLKKLIANFAVNTAPFRFTDRVLREGSFSFPPKARESLNVSSASETPALAKTMSTEP